MLTGVDTYWCTGLLQTSCSIRQGSLRAATRRPAYVTVRNDFSSPPHPIHAARRAIRTATVADAGGADRKARSAGSAVCKCVASRQPRPKKYQSTRIRLLTMHTLAAALSLRSTYWCKC